MKLYSAGPSPQMRRHRTIAIGQKREFTVFTIWFIVVQIQVPVFVGKPRKRRLIGKIFYVLLVAFSNCDQVLGKLAGVRVAMGEVFFKISTMTADRVAELRQSLKQIQDLAKLRFREFAAILQILESNFLRAERDQDPV